MKFIPIITKYYKFAFIAIFLLVSAIAIAVYFDHGPEIGVNEKSVPWLPSDATNISYYKHYSISIYEFEINEKSFKQWAKKWKVSEINKEFTIERFASLILKAPKFESDADLEKYLSYKNKTEISIERGYYYESPLKSNGGRMAIAYDLDSNKAYYYSLSR